MTALSSTAATGLHSVEFRADWSAEPYVRRVGWFRWEGWLIRKTRGLRLLNVGRSGEWSAEDADSVEATRISAVRVGLTRRAVLARLEGDKALVAEAYEALRKSTVHVHATAADGGDS